MNPFYLVGRFVSYAKRGYAEGLVAHTIVTASKAQENLDNEIIAIMRLPRRIEDGFNTGGGYISAIKQYRARSGTSLKEAKDHVDALYEKTGYDK